MLRIGHPVGKQNNSEGLNKYHYPNKNSQQLMEKSVLVHELRKVISLVDMLRDIGLDKHLSLPKIVVLGNQSSGKSSLVEQIVGLDFLPRGVGVVTRRPLQLRMNNVPELPTPYAEFEEIKDGGQRRKFTDFSQVRKQIEVVTDQVCDKSKNIKDIPIILNIYSSHCPNLTIVDLPGITLIPVKDQPENIYEVTKEMAIKYIREPRSIILCVIPANQDLTNSEALHLMRQVDPEGVRSVGCLTKIDIMNRGDDAMMMLKNQVVTLKYGYVGVKNRCQFDIDNNVSVQDSLKAEKQFFTTSPIYSRLPNQLFSTESLTKKLTTILYEQIKLSIPDILQQIKQKRVGLSSELEKLGSACLNSEEELVSYAWKSISKFMIAFTNSMSGVKNPCSDADPISSEIREELAYLYKEQLETNATAKISDKDIQKAMNNYFGGCTIAGYFTVDPFLALIYPLLKQLQAPAAAATNKIHSIMDSEAENIINSTMLKKFPQFNTKYNDMVRKVLEKHRKQLQNFLNVLLECELTYLHTNDAKYLAGDFPLTQKERQKKLKDPGVFELRKRVDSYFHLVVRNLRDLVPKQIINFLLIKCQKQLQFESHRFTQDLAQLKLWLREPEQVRAQRQAKIKALKVLEESEKRIRMDPDISKPVKRNLIIQKQPQRKQQLKQLKRNIGRQNKVIQKQPNKDSNSFIIQTSAIVHENPRPQQSRFNPLASFLSANTIPNRPSQQATQRIDRQPRVFTTQTFRELFGVHPRPKDKQS